MANKVRFGLKNVHYAVATIDPATNTATYATPVPWRGAVNLAMAAQDSNTRFRADNIDYWVGNVNNGYEGDYESALIPDSFKKDVMGYVEDKNGVLVEDANATGKPFALLFQFEGDANETRHVFYNCTASRASVEGATTEDTITPQTESITITAVAIHNASLDIDITKASVSPEQATQYSGWFDAVYQPEA